MDSGKTSTTLPVELKDEEHASAVLQDGSNPTSTSSSLGEPKEEEPARSVHGIKWALAYGSLISTVLFYSLDGTIVADIQPAILKSLGEIEKLPWIGVAIALGTIAILPLGKAYGVFNIKWLFLSCVIGFEVGSALCGAAPNMNAMIIGRVIQGVSGCGCYSGGLTYISMTTTKNERPLYLSGVVAMWGLGSVLGPVIGGAFAQSSATWRWAFYINLVVAAVIAPALIFCLPNLNPLDLPFRQKLRREDWIGIIVFLGGAACFTMAITFGGIEFAFNSGSEIALWTVTGVMLIVFCLVTAFHPLVSAADRLYPVHLMKHKDLNILQYAIFVASGAMMITLYYTPLIFQFTRSDGPLMAGVRLLPFVCLIVFFGIVNGALMPKFGYYMPWYVFGNAMILIGSSLMFTIDASTAPSRIYGYTALIGAGVGSFVTAGFAVVQALIPASDMNNAVGFMAIGQMMGQIALLSLAASLYQNIGANKIRDLLPDLASADIQQLTTGRQSAIFETLSESMQTAVIQQVTLAIRNTFAILIVASALAFIASCFLGRHKLY